MGAAGDSGGAAVEAALAAGQTVTALARRPEQLGASRDERLRVVQGDAAVPADVSRDKLRVMARPFFAVLLGAQVSDTERREREVRASGLAWVIVQPVHLSDDEVDDAPFVSTAGATRRVRVSRRQVGRFLVAAACEPTYVGHPVALSSP